MTSDALGHAASHVTVLGAPVAMMVVGLDGELLEVNDHLTTLLDRPREDLLGRYLHYLSTVHADTEAARHVLDEAAAGRSGGELAQVWSAGDGRVHVRIAWTLTRDEDGGPVGLTAVCLDETRRVLAERRVALSEARFEQSTIPQTTFDLSGRLLDANRAFCDLVGRPVERLAGRHVRDLGDRAEGRKAAVLVSRLLAGAVDRVQVERVIRDAAGRPVQVLAHASTLRDVDGTPLGVVAYLHDLTALRDVEQRRQQQEDFFLALSQRASDLVIVLDALGQVLYASPALGGALGHDPIDVMAEDLRDFVHPEDRTATTALIDHVVDGGESSATLRIRNAAGAWRWFEATMGNLLDTAVGGVVCNLRDVTERITAERALRASEARYRAIADSADEGLWVASADGRTLYVNTRLCDILGLDADEVYEREVGELVAGAPGATLDQSGAAGRGRPGALRDDVRPPRRAHPDAADRRRPAGGRGRRGRPAGVPRHGQRHHRVPPARARAAPGGAARQPDRPAQPGAAARPARARADPARPAAPPCCSSTSTSSRSSTTRVATPSATSSWSPSPTGSGPARARSTPWPASAATSSSSSARTSTRSTRTGSPPSCCSPSTCRSWSRAARCTSTPPSASRSSPSPSAEHLLRNAETAMYAAKRAGRRGIRVFDTSLAEQAQELYELGADLRAALAADELVMHYQPIVELAHRPHRRHRGAGPLEPPDHRPIPPDRFVGPRRATPACPASWTGGRSPGAARARRPTAAQARCRRDAYVAVNLSPRHLADAGARGVTCPSARRRRRSPADVMLEITERAIMADGGPRRLLDPARRAASPSRSTTSAPATARCRYLRSCRSPR